MAFVVPFDASELAETALVRAAEFSEVLDERVVAVTVIPRDAEYAREREWISPEESFDPESVVQFLHERVVELVPSADFRHRTVGRYAPAGKISTELSRLAEQEDASMVFIGSENAGRMVRSVTSVGGAVAEQVTYDVVIVRNRAPSKVDRLEQGAPPAGKSDFYPSD